MPCFTLLELYDKPRHLYRIRIFYTCSFRVIGAGGHTPILSSQAEWVRLIVGEDASILKGDGDQGTLEVGGV